MISVKNDKLYFIKIKIFLGEWQLREQKAKSQRKYLLINHIINNGFLSKIFFNSQNSTGRKQTTEFKNEQRT